MSKLTTAAQTKADCLLVLNGRTQLLKPLQNSTLVITGGTGFLGSWLAQMLACLNDEFKFGTRVLFVSRQQKALPKSYAHFSARSDFEYLKADVRYPFEVPTQTNWFIHAAANPNTRVHASEPTEVMSTIARGTEHALRAIERCGDFRMFLNLSSGLAYGPQPWDLERIPESFLGAPNSLSTTSSYSEAKRYGETLTASARSQWRIPTLNVRPFAFVGPFQDLDGPWAVTNFLHDALNGVPIRIFGDGKTVRSYLYGADAAYWILRILTAGQAGSCTNLGSPEAVALESLAEMIAESIKPRPDYRLSSAPSPDHRSRFVPSAERAQKELGLEVIFPLKTALERSVSWYQNLARESK